MARIAGWIDWRRDLSGRGAVLREMADRLRHRGTDADGHWVSPHALLAHRQAAANGEQPATSVDAGRRYAIGFDGVLLNARELAGELRARGHELREESDAEVVLRAYVQWGHDCVQRLDGFFAFGIWDDNCQRLLLARDRVGAKPLFYALRGSGVVFGSELKALLAHPEVDIEVGPDGMAEILTFVRTPGSGVYRGVREVRPAHVVVCGEAGARETRYWCPAAAPHGDDLSATVRRVRSLVEEATARQLATDAPVAALLSGGLDSSLLAALASERLRACGAEVDTYSIDFQDGERLFHADPLHVSRDEPWARTVADHLGTRHHTVTVSPEALVDDMLVQLHGHDLPMVGQMNTSLHLLFSAMTRNASVVLSGEGADEIFGGYPWYQMEPMLRANVFPWLPAFLGQPGPASLSWVSPEVLRSVRPFEHLLQRYQQTVAEVPRLEGEEPTAARRREMLYVDLVHWLPFLLERKDRAGAAAGIEVRVPFADHHLVEYAWNIPWEIRMVDSIEKGVLRRAFADVLPGDVVGRRKSAYPTVQDPDYDAATRAWARRIVEDRDAPVQPLLDRDVVLAALDEGGSGRSGMAQVSLFERIIMLNQWLEQYRVSLSL